jgi:hypothetical protein
MRKLPIQCALAAFSTISAAVPNLFSPGKPVISQDVNANFATLDTAIQAKASKVEMSNAHSAILSLQSSIGKKADSTWVSGQLAKIPAETLTIKALQAKGEGRIDVNSNLAAHAGVSVDTLKSGSTVVGPGSVTMDTLYAKNIGITSFFGTSSNLPAHYYSNLHFYTSGAAYGNSFVHYYPMNHWVERPTVPTVGNLRVWNGAGGFDVLKLEGHTGQLTWQVGSGAVNTLAHSGNIKALVADAGGFFNNGGTITGDLRISGKLTTNPGATPADYVFEPDYKLASLSEVEAYTKANKHLPEVPSAAEMTNNGVDLAAMNMVLLKKVEELTLHAIALQKDVEAQKAQMADQQKAMVEMKAYLELLRKN